MKKVSVVVPCYNAAMYLDKCVQYLLNQTIGLENIEIILVNDASTDDGATLNIMLKYETQYPDSILVVSLEENMRQGGARNVGISYASGEYLIFCDADDWLMLETLEHAYQAAKDNDADVVEFLGTNVIDRECSLKLEKGDKNRLVELDTEEKRKKFLMYVGEDFSYGSQTKLYRLSMIQKNHIRFAEHLIFEEPSFVVPIRLYEKRHYFLDERLYVWYLSPESTMRSGWGTHKWDNPKVWLLLIEDLDKRGMLHKYFMELEYMFFDWAMSLTLKLLVQKGYVLGIEEVKFLNSMVLRVFPNITQNEYICQKVCYSEWYQFLITLLNINITDESIQLVNQFLRKYVL